MIAELRQEFAAALFVDCGNVKNVIAAPLCTLGTQKKTHVPEMKKTLNIVENCVRKKLPTTICNLLPGNFRIIGNQFVHFNYEIDNVYYDAMYYAKDSEITKLNPDYEIMLDSVILNKQTGDVRSVHTGTEDLSRILNDEISGYKTKTETDKTTGETVIKIIEL